MQFDATIADDDIKFPTDLSLLNDSREKSEEILGFICKKLQTETPRTYKRVARARKKVTNKYKLVSNNNSII